MQQLYNGDCLEVMKEIPDKSIDMILTDPPYGTTQNKWDSVIPLNLMWEQLERIIKDNGAIVLFSDGLFTAELMLSNKKHWKYNLIWDKILPTGFLNANRMPLKSSENISVFYRKQPVYNPQKWVGNKNHSKTELMDCKNSNYNNFRVVDNSDKLGNLKHPRSILRFEKPHPSKSLHPTQKPVDLLEYLIKTYTNEGETVLDFTMGSGSTGVACKNLNRNFIGIELDEEYFKIAEERLKNVKILRKLV